MLYILIFAPFILVLVGVGIVVADTLLNKETKKENEEYAKSLYKDE